MGKRMGVFRAGLRIRNLPGILGEVARVCGDAAALRFAAAFGDSDFYVPTVARLRPDHPLVVAMGQRAAMLIARRFGGREYSVPTGRISLRHHSCRVMRLAGWQPREIARALNLRQGTVEELVADVEPAAGTPQPVAIVCPSCGRPHRIAPAAASPGDPGAPPDDADLLASLPPLIRLAVETGAIALTRVRELERMRAGAD